MKPKTPLLLALSFLLLSIIACGPLATAIPPASQAVEQATHAASIPTQAIASPTVALQPSREAITPTAEEPTLEPATAVPTPIPQPAAPAHFAAGTPIQLDEIHMVSLTEGWGISGRYLLTTADGGKTWREVSPDVNNEDQIYGTFLDRQTAWVVFSNSGQISPQLTVYRTTDGGQTWTYFAQSLAFYINVTGDRTWAELTVLDAQHIWVMARGVYVGAGTHYNHELFQSTDGGISWTSLDGEISSDYTGMVFIDPTFGIRSMQNIGAYENWAPSYDQTTDGGATWDNNELPAPADAPDLVNQYPYCETYQPSLLSRQSIHMLVGCFDYDFPSTKFTSYLYSSQDGGNTWTTAHLPNKVLASEDRLFFFDAEHALLLGKEMYQSTDGGQTWTHVQTVSWDAQFSFVDAQHGWATGGAEGEKALVNTKDGGKTWVLIKPVATK